MGSARTGPYFMAATVRPIGRALFQLCCFWFYQQTQSKNKSKSIDSQLICIWSMFVISIQNSSIVLIR